LNELLGVLAGMGETITRQELIREVADRLDTEPALVVHRLERAGRGGGTRQASRPTALSRPEGDPAAEQRRAPAPPPRELGPQERREEALLAMCIAAPALGADFIERLTPEHFATDANRRALEWLREHVEEPLEGIPREDEQLVAQINRLTQMSEPASEQAMTTSWLQLEVRRMDRAIGEARSAGAGDTDVVALQRRRAELVEALARGAPVGP
jgi:hypothetical protein